MILADYELKKCIQCGKNPKGPYISLKDNNIIDPSCLQQIEKLAAEPDIDEAIAQVFKHILNLVVKCTKCGCTLDGVFKINANKVNSNPYCKQCHKNLSFKDLKLEQKPVQVQCIQCQSILRGLHILSAVKFDGLYVCKECSLGEKPSIVQQKPKHNPFNKRQQRNMLFDRKKSLPNIYPYPVPKLKQEKIFQQKYPFIDFGLKEPSRIKCQMCFIMYPSKLIHNIQNQINVCLNCRPQFQMKENNYEKKSKKTINKNNQDFGLTDLFMETPESNDEKKQELQKIPKTDIFQQKVKTEIHRSSIYKQKECKLCFNGQSNMINIKCRHLMMCEGCHKSYKAKHNHKQEIPCPVCTVVGRYQLYIVPIYI